jgi:hypothetical protein
MLQEPIRLTTMKVKLFFLETILGFFYGHQSHVQKALR